MDYLPGKSLKQIRKPVPYKTAIHLIRPIADALAYAHENGIFHRDVKPGNIMLTAKGMPVLTDFGIAKLLDTDEGHTLTASGVGIGTPEYMAPEQGFGREIDGRADQYALAIVLYELITAHKPFQGDTPMDVIYKQYNDPLPPMRESAPDVPTSVEAVIQKALSKLPDQRFPDMTSFARALEDAVLPGNSQLTFTAPPAQTDTPVFDSQPRPDSDTVPVMPFNTGTNSKVKPQPTTPSKQKPQLSTWLVPLALLVVVGAFFFLRRPDDSPVTIPSKTSRFPTSTAEPIPTETLVSPVEQTQRAFNAYQTEAAQANELVALEATINAFHQTETAVRWTPTSLPTSTPQFTWMLTPTPTLINIIEGTFELPYDDWLLTLTPTLPVEAATVSDFLEKRQYARLGAYIRDLTNPTLQEKLRQFVYDKLYDGEIRLAMYSDCNGVGGYINVLGDVVIEPMFSYEDTNFSGGLAELAQSGLVDVISLYGESGTGAQFDSAKDFSEGLAAVKKNDRWGYINAQGDVVREPQFDDVRNFSEGLAAVMTNGKWGYINTQGEIAIEPKVDWAGDFHEGLAAVEQNGKYGYINTNGEIVAEPQFDDAKDFSEGLAVVKKYEQFGYLNSLGEVVVEPQFDDAKDFSEGLAKVEKNGKYGYINTYGEIVLEPQFDDAEDFSEGLAAIKKNGLWGYINTHGEIVLQPQFEIGRSFSSGLAAILQSDQFGYINRVGEVVIEPQFEFADDFYEGLAAVEQNGLWGYINTHSDFIVEPELYYNNFVFPEPFTNGLARIYQFENNYFIDPTGETVFVPCQK